MKLIGYKHGIQHDFFFTSETYNTPNVSVYIKKYVFMSNKLPSVSMV